MYKVRPSLCRLWSSGCLVYLHCLAEHYSYIYDTLMSNLDLFIHNFEEGFLRSCVSNSKLHVFTVYYVCNH